MVYRLFAGLLLACAVALPAPVRADIRDGDFEIQGWCVDAVDYVFDDAVLGRHNPDAVVNGNNHDHVHVNDLIAGGFIPNREALVGHAFVFSGYWATDGGKHFHAYVPKDDAGLEQVSCPVALQTTNNTKDQYLAEGVDVEMQRNHGLGSSGQTNTEQGKRRGEE